jgi:DNA-binding transcriptional ArsR family regulator
MKRRRRVLAETLIILASALVVLILLTSSPAEAGAPPINPPVEADPPNPISNQGTNPSLPVEDPSENAEDDSAASQPAEQIEEPNDDVIDNSQPSNSGETQTQPQPTKQQPKPVSDDGSTDESQLPDDNSMMDASTESAANSDSSLQSLEVKDDVLTAEHDLTKEETQFNDEDSDHELSWDYEDADDDAEFVMEDELKSDVLEETEEESLIDSQELGEDDPVEKKPEVRDEPKRESSSSEKKEKEKGLTTSSGIEVVEIKVSSHIDKIVEEPITKFLFGMYTRLDTAEDLRGVRKKIYQYIKAHPGEHMATLMKEFKLSPSSISHHINVLEKNGFIISHNDGRYKRLFVNGNGYISTVSDNYKCQISALKNENAKKIVFFLMARPASTQYELSNALDLHPSTIHWHAKKLMSLGLISAIRDGKNIRYTVDDSSCVIKVLSVVETVNV